MLRTQNSLDLGGLEQISGFSEFPRIWRILKDLKDFDRIQTETCEGRSLRSLPHPAKLPLASQKTRYASFLLARVVLP